MGSIMLLKKRKKLPHSAVSTRDKPRSENAYLRALSDFYSKVAERTSILALKKISKRLKMSNADRPIVKISKIVEELNGSVDKVAVVVAKVIDDDRMIEIPQIKLIALNWSKGVKEKVEKYHGTIKTLDQLFGTCLDMNDICLISGDKFARRSAKFWGPAPGEKNSATYPRGSLTSHNHEKRIMMRNRRIHRKKKSSKQP